MAGGYKSLDVWKKAMQLTNLIYDITADFPKNEIYGLAAQMRRAVVSIPSNIAEGSSRGGTAEYIQLLNISRGSLSELDTQLIIANNRNYISKQQLEQAENLIEDIARMLNRLLQAFKNKRTNSNSRIPNP